MTETKEENILNEKNIEFKTFKDQVIFEKSEVDMVFLDEIQFMDTKDTLHNVEIILNKGIDVVTGKIVNMIKAGIIDPVLVTKTALINAASVASTIISADCIISNVRDESN